MCRDEGLWSTAARQHDHDAVDVDDLELAQVRSLLDQLAHQRLIRPLAPEAEQHYRQLCAREAELLRQAS